MASLILTPLAALGSLFTGAVSDDGSQITQAPWTAPPQSPADARFPACAFEVAPDQEHQYVIEGLGLGRFDYMVQGYIFVGAPGANDPGMLHNLACAWVKPVAYLLVSNQKLTGNGISWFIAVGNNTARGGFFKFWIQGIAWNPIGGGTNLYGMRFLFPVIEKPTQSMA